ncbi:MAG: plasma-membrane proton-efflux P-type ATPase [Proteobacteria bacterium]|nr:plasma-membrane proton-efflux P-type ATPase [Pseudomonadota bacterium]
MDDLNPSKDRAGANLPESEHPTGLTDREAAARLAQFGPNAIRERSESTLHRLRGFFWGPIPWMIEIAAALSAVVRHWADLAIILVMLVLNAGVGFWQEHKAGNAIAALKQKLALKARVLRDGQWRDIAAAELVPNDIVTVQLGNIVPADLTLLSGDFLSVDQSALTGESLPVDKKVGDTAYSGSIVKLGEMTGRVTATGMNTYFGKTARLIESAHTVSHFQRAVLRIGNFLIIVTVGLVAFILGAALYRHDPPLETIQFALVLTVAAIPVALPAVLSVTMAVGAERLAGMKAIVSRLVSIEELAGLNMLCCDKTGTLTRNELTLGDPVRIGAADIKEVLVAAALASTRETADPIDRAIFNRVHADDLSNFVIRHFTPFDPVRKRTEGDIVRDGKAFKVSKGAAQVIVALAKPDAETAATVDAAVDAFARDGYRALAVARTDETGHWRILGVLPLFDPPREDSASTIAKLQRVGVAIKMVTGDHIAIARQIAARLDLGRTIFSAPDLLSDGVSDGDRAKILAADGFAEVFPEHKFAIVKALQAEGYVVGMTGDGVNDAPAIKQADVGIAVSGATDAARSAAGLVLTAPGLTVIASAIEESRRIFERMTSYATYRIAETVRVLLFMTVSILVFNFYPVTAVMIVLLALFNDFPIMMIAYDNAPVAERPVVWNMRRVLGLAFILGFAGVIASFLMFVIARDYFGLPPAEVQSMVFLKLLVAGHMTIYLTRNTGPIWQRPWPNWRLVVTSEATQILGTVAVLSGWFVAPLAWPYVIFVWLYSLLWFAINSAVKIAAIAVFRRLRNRTVKP